MRINGASCRRRFAGRLRACATRTGGTPPTGWRSSSATRTCAGSSATSAGWASSRPTGFDIGPVRMAQAAPAGTFDIDNSLTLALGYRPAPLEHVFEGEVTGDRGLVPRRWHADATPGGARQAAPPVARHRRRRLRVPPRFFGGRHRGGEEPAGPGHRPGGDRRLDGDHGDQLRLRRRGALPGGAARRHERPRAADHDRHQVRRRLLGRGRRALRLPLHQGLRPLG